jgi:serine/threonine-protein kinase HipA
MRKAAVYCNGEFAGTLTEASRSGYVFRYENGWFHNAAKPAISLTLPKTQQEYYATTLFPFFSNLLSEGANRKLQSTHLKIDEAADVRTYFQNRVRQLCKPQKAEKWRAEKWRLKRAGLHFSARHFSAGADEADRFGLLLATAQDDTAGAVTVRPLTEE